MSLQKYNLWKYKCPLCGVEGKCEEWEFVGWHCNACNEFIDNPIKKIVGYMTKFQLMKNLDVLGLQNKTVP